MQGIKYFLLASSLFLGACQTQSFIYPPVQRAVKAIQASSYRTLHQISKEHFHNTFVEKDKNKDQRLDLLEANLDMQAFKELDLNQDSFLAESEMFPPALHAEFILSMRALAQDELKRYDQDKSANLSYEEFVIFAREYLNLSNRNHRQLFQDLDRNRNQYLTLSEFETVVAQEFVKN